MLFQVLRVVLWFLSIHPVIIVLALPQAVTPWPKYLRSAILPTSTASPNFPGKYVKPKTTASTMITRTHIKGLRLSPTRNIAIPTSVSFDGCEPYIDIHYFATATFLITETASSITVSPTLPSSISIDSGTLALAMTLIGITPTPTPTLTSSFSRPFFTSTPPSVLTTSPWVTPIFAPACTDGPKPSYTSTLNFDDIKVDWWYAAMPERYHDVYFHGFSVYDSRIVDPEWAEMATSKFNFAVHGPNEVTNLTGDPDYSGFIALPNGATFDVVSFWIQCDYGPCQVRVFEMDFDLVERELFLTDGSRLTMLGGFTNDDGMKFLNMEETFGPNAGKKIRWLRMYAKDLRDNVKVPWRTFSNEVSIGLDDLVVIMRAKLPNVEQGCAERKGNLTRRSSRNTELA